ncbi:hypothetical protein ACLOJK_024489 [Asimina triloba]
MFKAARWRSEKNKIKVEFKLQIHATQVPQVGYESLMVSLIPEETGKPTVKSGKAAIQDGICRWEDPIYETVRFSREPKTGKISEKIYQFLVSTGNSKSGLLGEVSIDLADYFEPTRPSSISLPLKTSNSGTVLHVTLQRIQAAADGRDGEENGDATMRSNGRSLKSQFSNADTEGSFRFSNGTGNFVVTDVSSHLDDQHVSLLVTFCCQNGNLYGINVECKNQIEVLIGYQQYQIDAQIETGSTDNEPLGLEIVVSFFPDSSPLQIQFGSDHNKDTSQPVESNGFYKPSTGNESGSASSLDSSSGQDSLQELGLKNNGIQQDDTSFLSSLRNNATLYQKPTGHPLRSLTDIQEHRRSNTDWSLSSAQDGSIDESTNSEETTFRERTQSSNASIEKFKNEIAVLSRQADVSGLELQTLRKQIAKESRRGAELSKEIGSLKEERDATKRECERLKALQRDIDNGKVSNKPLFDDQKQKHLLEEIRQELIYEKDLNANLRLQLQKTQESNTELILAVQDLEELLERKNNEALCLSDTKTSAASHNNGGPFLQHCDSSMENVEAGSKYESDDEEQQALDRLVREHVEADMAYSLEQKIIDLSCEIEMFKKEREELEMQMEQLALDYEILKQENHDISAKLEQNRLQEQLKLQYECSASLAAVSDLENQVESLEKELQKQAEAFEADLMEIAQAKIEQEQRAIRAEEALRKMRWNNANTAERLQEEFRILSMQMASTFDANEKLAVQALSDASELRLEKKHLEDLLEKANEENALVKDQYQAKVEELSRAIDLKTKEGDKLKFEIEEKVEELQNQKQYLAAKEKDFLKEISFLQTMIEKVSGEKNDLFEQVKQSKNLGVDVEQKERSIKEMEILLEKGAMEREELERKVKEAEKLLQELYDVKLQKDEKETVVESLESEVAILRAQYNDLKHTLFEDELEKENLRKQVFHLKGDLRKKEESITAIERKLKDNNTRILNTDGTIRSASRSNKMNRSPPATKEVSNLREKIKLLEGEIKQKEAAFESSTISFLKKEKDLSNRIEELEKFIEEGNQKNNICFSKDKVIEEANGVENGTINSVIPRVKRNDDENLGAKAYHDQNGIDKLPTRSTTNTNLEQEMEACGDSNGQDDNADLLNQIASLRERNDSMEKELKEMQERYSGISLKFAEVEEMEASGASNGQDDNADLLNQMASLRERNDAMEKELKEMQERYSGISLKFAEVEGERQQLVMAIRNLKNAKKN